MPLILPSNSISAGGYEVDNSLRFNRASSDFLNKTLGTPTNADIATFSTWVKFCDVTSSNDTVIFGVYTDGNNTTYFERLGDASLRLIIREGSSYIGNIQTNRKLRDPSAWMHIVIAFDTTQGTGSNRVKLYINGVQETSFSTGTYPTQNVDLRFNTSGQVFNIGNRGSNVNYPDAYFAETVFVDGQQLDPTSFGEFDEDTGIWKPIDVSGLTFGTNGFYLDFENSGSLGADVSGNGNNFTVNNLTSIDQTTDTPTNNFATFNPLFVYGSSAISPSYSDGNLTAIFDNGSENEHSPSTFAVSSGKWYAEFKWVSATGDGSTYTGVLPADANVSSDLNAQSYAYLGNGNKRLVNTTSSYGATYGSGDIISIALNCDDNQITFYKNGVSQGALSIASNKSYFMYMSDYASSGNRSVDANFGTPETSVSSGNTDGNGYGNFEYSVPSGYYALNTKNLAEYG
jgi:hypothetical protein